MGIRDNVIIIVQTIMASGQIVHRDVDYNFFISPWRGLYTYYPLWFI